MPSIFHLKLRISRIIFVHIFSLLFVFQRQLGFAQVSATLSSGQHSPKNPKEVKESEKVKGTFKHQLNIEYRFGRMLSSDPFYRIQNIPELSVGTVRSGHLKYAFALPERTLGGHIFPNTHQGLGVAAFDFGNAKELGTPLAVYLFQKSEITRLLPSLSLDYEWNFGLSTGWKPYDSTTNPNNIIVGSRVNAYINLGASIRWQFTKQIALNGGLDFTHFSNGNTEYPNSGVNIPGVKVGVTYDVSGRSEESDGKGLKNQQFPRHISYDMVIFGSWRRKGVDFFGQQVASPQKYPVLGAYFAPMYNWGHRLRTGVSLDAIYDGSANVYTEDYIVGTEQEFFSPGWKQQVALGLSARVDYVMPLFTIGAGIGTHVLHKGGDFKGTYQAFALKIRATRSSFIHIGYNIKDFHEPNYLMLGLGYRFNNRTPSLLSR